MTPRNLTGNALKLIAAAAMVIDHVGLMFFPEVAELRILGRLALPIFAFMIAEGCRYTKSKVRYFLHIFCLAAICQAVYYVAQRSTYMCILVTFSLTILMIFALQGMKKAFASSASLWRKLASTGIFAATVVLSWILNRHLRIDYGFWGCMVGVFAALLHPVDEQSPQWMKQSWVHVLMLSLGLLILALDRGGVQIFSLMAVPLLLMYSGKRGKLSMKYFFYIFYPAHLVILQGISWLIR